MEGKSATIDIPTMMKKRLVVTGSTLRGRPIAEHAAIAKDLEKNIWPLIEAGVIKPHIDTTFPLADAARAGHGRIVAALDQAHNETARRHQDEDGQRLAVSAAPVR